MKYRYAFPLLGVAFSLLCVVSPAQAAPATASHRAPIDAAVLVRVTRVRAIGPDGREATVFSERDGRLVSVMDMSGLDGFDPGLASGAYYALRAEIANELHVVDGNGKMLTTAFSRDGTVPELPLSGAVVVAEKRVQAFGLVPEFVLAGQPDR